MMLIYSSGATNTYKEIEDNGFTSLPGKLTWYPAYRLHRFIGEKERLLPARSQNLSIWKAQEERNSPKFKV